MLPIKFQVNWPSVQEKKKKIDFQDGHHGRHLGFPMGMILATFYQVSSQLAHGCRRSRLLKQLLTCTMDDERRMTHDKHWLITTAHPKHDVLRWANKQSQLHLTVAIILMVSYTYEASYTYRAFTPMFSYTWTQLNLWPSLSWFHTFIKPAKLVTFIPMFSYS